MLIVFIFLTININRDKALQMEIDEQFIFNSIIYEVFIQLGYVGEPRKCLSSKYWRTEKIFTHYTTICSWKC